MKNDVKARKWFHDAGIKKIFVLTIAFKLTALTVIAVGAVFLPFNTANYTANFHYPPYRAPDFFTRFTTWDAQHYLYLADHGYAPGLMSDTFYPLFPFLVHLASFLFFGNALAAGLLLSTLFTLGSMLFLYSLVRKIHGEEAALNSCLLLLAFPMSFFLGLVYADSLFLMLAVGFFYFSQVGKGWLAIICAFLLPLTKPTGILAAVFSFATVFCEKWPTYKGDYFNRRYYLYAAISLGFLAYLLVMEWLTGNYLSGFTAQHYFNSGYSIQNLFHPIDWILKNFIDVSYSFNGPTNGVVSRLVFIGFLVWLVTSFKTVGDPLWFYALVVGLVSALSGDLMSFSRYLVMIFPIFITMAIRFKSSVRYLAWAFALVQIAFILLYSINEWVA
ncbi:MAG TPA: hypothetical protein VK791_06475 [bacterium]|nr:hypothetical protein [bacterium]